MTKRKKRLEKGIKAIEQQLKEHEEKRRKALESGDEELAQYYDSDIGRLFSQQKRKKQQLNR